MRGNIVPDVSALRDVSDSVSPPDLFLTCTGNLGSSGKDQEGEDGDGGLSCLPVAVPI